VFYRWYPSISVATCKWQRQGRQVANVKEPEMGIGVGRLRFWAVSHSMCLLLCFFQVSHAASEGQGHMLMSGLRR